MSTTFEELILVILLGAGDDNPRALKWGHWSPARWTVPTEGHRSEVLIAGESLRRPARPCRAAASNVVVGSV